MQVEVVVLMIPLDTERLGVADQEIEHAERRPGDRWFKRYSRRGGEVRRKLPQ